MTRKPGRPPGAKNKPKQAREPSRMGRPSAWPESLQPARKTNRRVPAIFDEAMNDQDFRDALIQLLLDFSLRKS